MRDADSRSIQSSGIEQGGSSSTSETGYSASSIQVLEGLEAVRKRPGMYVGLPCDEPTDAAEWVWFGLRTCIADHLARRVRSVSVRLDHGWVEVFDDGPGVTAAPGEHGHSALAVVTTCLHWGGGASGSESWFPTGIEWPCLNALSSRFELESHHDGRVARIGYERGHLVDPARVVGRTDRSGTHLRFRPDPQIFRHPSVDPAHLEARLRDLAWLAPLLRVVWQGRTLPGLGGLPDMLRVGGARDVVQANHSDDRQHVDLAIGWSAAGDTRCSSFYGFARTEDSAPPAVWRGLIHAARVSRPELSESVIRELLEPGLRVAAHINSAHPRWAHDERMKTHQALLARRVRDLFLWNGRVAHQVLRRRLDGGSF